MIVVALWTANVVWFHYENFSFLFGGCFVVKPLYQKLKRFSTFIFSLQYDDLSKENEIRISYFN